MRRRSAGFTTLEMIVVLGIIGVLAAVFLGSQVGKERSSKVQACAGIVSELISASNRWRETQGSVLFTGITITQLVNNNLYPTNMHAFGGGITVASANNGRSVRITLQSIPDNISANNLVSILTARGGNNTTLSGTGPYNVRSDF